MRAQTRSWPQVAAPCPCRGALPGFPASITALSSELVRQNETQLAAGMQDGSVAVLTVAHEHARCVPAACVGCSACWHGIRAPLHTHTPKHAPLPDAHACRLRDGSGVHSITLAMLSTPADRAGQRNSTAPPAAVGVRHLLFGG
jgi:hypothetical protein